MAVGICYRRTNIKDTDKTKEQLISELKTVHQEVKELSTFLADNKKSEDELRQSHEQYRSIFNLAPDGIIRQD